MTPAYTALVLLGSGVALFGLSMLAGAFLAAGGAGASDETARMVRLFDAEGWLVETVDLAVCPMTSYDTQPTPRGARHARGEWTRRRVAHPGE